MGHLNQSIAFARYLNASYEIVEVRFRHKLFKALSYLLDRMGIYTARLVKADVEDKPYDYVVGAGSGTYYATKVFSKLWDTKSVTMMLPKGYRLDFDLIYTQRHDHAPKQHNIIELPANFSYVEPKGIYHPQKKKRIGIVIGGDNKVFRLSAKRLKTQLDTIVKHYQGYEIAVTTSPRTSTEVEALVEEYAFDYRVIFSQNPVNPIPDFLNLCESIFITGDSTSMISEAISYGKSNVVVLPLESKKDNKFAAFIKTLSEEGYLHSFDGTIVNKNKKIGFSAFLPEKRL